MTDIENIKKFCNTIIQAAFYNYDSGVSAPKIIRDAIDNSLIDVIPDRPSRRGEFSHVKENGYIVHYRNNLYDFNDEQK